MTPTNDTPESVLACRDCGDTNSEGREVELIERNGRHFCITCHDERYMRECRGCGDSVDVDDMIEGYYCSDSCYEDENSDSEDTGNVERGFNTESTRHQSASAGATYIESDRKFSAEIECFYPDYETLEEVASVLPREVGISGDGSLGSNGIEFQTPILKGKAGEDLIIHACKTLGRAGFEVTRQAGLHIHLDGAGLNPRTRTRHNPQSLKALWAFYIGFEDVLLSFLPPSRRGNQYCRLVKNAFHLSEIEQAETLEKLEQVWYRAKQRQAIKSRKSDKYDSSRYFGVNLHSLFANGHLEIRYHSGTLNAEKILYWVRLHQAIMDKAGGLWGYAMKAQATPNLADKTKLFFEALELGESAQKYLLERQKTFTSIAKDNDETVLTEDNDTPVCAE